MEVYFEKMSESLLTSIEETNHFVHCFIKYPVVESFGGIRRFLLQSINNDIHRLAGDVDIWLRNQIIHINHPISNDTASVEI